MIPEARAFPAAGSRAAWALAVIVPILIAAASCTPEKGGPASRSEKPSAAGQIPDPLLPVDEMPKPLASPPPSYPEEARANGVEGIVYVRALVGKDGAVSNAAVDPTHPASPLLERAAIDAVSRWTFSPAKLKGQAVDTWIIVPVRFSLDGGSKKPGE